MIELMLEAERALAVGLLDKAEGYYRQVATNDPRNAIAVVGLARVALERGDQLSTYLFARKALAIDPDNPAASHLAYRMAEQLAMRGEPVPGEERASAASPTSSPSPSASAPVAPDPASAPPPPGPATPALRARRRGILDRLRGRAR